MTPLVEAGAAPELREDIRRLGDLLGQALARQEGEATLDLVESMRALVREDPEAAAARIDELTLAESTTLARAFALYFQLANIAEQVHRSRALAKDRAETGGPLAGAARAIGQAIADGQVGQAEVAEGFARIGARPVFTAHPTEASRRSVLLKLRRWPTCWRPRGARPATATSPRSSTCCGRPTSCAWTPPR